MTDYLVKRLLHFFILGWIAASLVFFLIHLLPGDPIDGMLGVRGSGRDIQRVREELGLNRPLVLQYADFIVRLPRLDLGRSIVHRRKVTELIAAYFPNTLVLSLASLLVSLILSVPLGLWAAIRRGSPLDTGVVLAASLGQAIPNYFLGPLLVLLFSILLGWLPVSGSGDAVHLVLPALTLGWSMSALQLRIVRTAVLEELEKPYVLLALAKGVPPGRLLRRHVLRNALIPILTTAGLQLGALLTGTVITETVFSWQGIGRLLVTAVRGRDYPLVQGLVLCMTFVFLIVHLVVDLVQAAISPRIRFEIRKR